MKNNTLTNEEKLNKWCGYSILFLIGVVCFANSTLLPVNTSGEALVAVEKIQMESVESDVASSDFIMSSAISIPDVSGPQLMTGSIESEGVVHDLNIVPVGYGMADLTEFTVIDVGGEDNLFIAGKVLDSVDDSQLIFEDNIFYLLDSHGLYVMGGKDMENAGIVGNLELQGVVRDMGFSQSYAYIAYNKAEGNSFNGVRVVDLEDANNPILVETIIVGANVLNVEVSGGSVYVNTDSQNDNKIEVTHAPASSDHLHHSKENRVSKPSVII